MNSNVLYVLLPLAGRCRIINTNVRRESGAALGEKEMKWLYFILCGSIASRSKQRSVSSQVTYGAVKRLGSTFQYFFSVSFIRKR
jgi:hypothetical protein